MTKYTPEMVKEICKYLREGETIKDTCAMVGISKETFYDWSDRFPDFAAVACRAEGEAARERTQRLRAAGVRAHKRFIKGPDGKEMEVMEIEGDWKADAWWLERRRRDDYALKSIQDVNQSVTFDQGTKNALQLVAAVLAGAKKGRGKSVRGA